MATSPTAATDRIPANAAQLPITVDIVAFTVRGEQLSVLLIERALLPFKGKPALPGGFVLTGETTEQAAVRELREETGVRPPGHLEQLRSYGPLGRDPRGPVLAVAYMLLAPGFDLPQAGGDAAKVFWASADEALATGLAFDHDQILRDGLERARSKIEYSPLATSFCPPEFTIAELRKVYEAVWGVQLDPRNFHRKATKTSNFLEDTGAATAAATGRPAALFRLQPGVNPTDAVLHPPLVRPKQ